ncbi:MAG: DHH family phosphoesterase [Patescibacteria group bacterium]
MNKDKILVTSNANPDLDGYASAIGYTDLLKKQGKNAQAILLGNFSDEIIFVANYLKEKVLPVFEGNLDQFDQIIMVDTSFLGTLGKEISPQKLKEIIDHRIANESHLYPWAKVQIELVGSCATLIVEKYKKTKIEPSKEIAVYLYGAIASNTINFKSNLTTKRDIVAANYLKKLTKIPDNFINQMFVFKSDLTGEKLFKQMTHDVLDHLEFNNKKIFIFQIESANCKDLIENRINEINNFVFKSLKGKNIDFVFTNIIDIVEGYNYIISMDEKTRKFLEDVLGLEFNNNVAKTDSIIMRKEIVAKIKDYFC